MKAREIIYHGRVQGVGFRYSVKQLAAGYDVSGAVENLPDGTVRLLLQGEESEINEMQRAIQESHLNGFIRKTETFEIAINPLLRGFEIVR